VGRLLSLPGTLVLLLSTAGAALLIFLPMRRRLQTLEAAAHRLGAGDLAAHAPADGHDEIARLAEAFNRMAAQLDARDQALQVSDDLRRQMLADVSHELKTPLTVVAGFLETLQDMELDSRQRARYLNLMVEQARNMQRLVDDLLTLSALESDQNAPVETSFDVVPLLLAISADAKALAEGRHTVTLDIGEPATIVGNRDELASAFGNLASNAVRYTPDGGEVRLAWRVDASGRGEFSVTDNGIGIAPEHVPRLTERFYRVDRGRSRAGGGTGLGLAIVKHVLLRHQAEFDVMSELGKGSTFTVILPARRIRRQEPMRDAMSQPPAAGTISSPSTTSN
jgi:signal transduction histidine kinase